MSVSTTPDCRNLDRRSFLEVAASVLGLLTPVSLMGSINSSLSVHRFLSLVPDIRSANILGRKARIQLAAFAKVGDRNNQSRLVESLSAILPTHGSIRALKETYQRQVETEFEKGKTVRLDGWVLAVSEVRLWSLVNCIHEESCSP